MTTTVTKLEKLGNQKKRQKKINITDQIRFKLDRVALLITNPPPTNSIRLSKKNFFFLHALHDMWHAKSDTWHAR